VIVPQVCPRPLVFTSSLIFHTLISFTRNAIEIWVIKETRWWIKNEDEFDIRFFTLWFPGVWFLRYACFSIFSAEDSRIKFLRNVGYRLQLYTMWTTWRPQFKSSPMWKRQIANYVVFIFLLRLAKIVIFLPIECQCIYNILLQSSDQHKLSYVPSVLSKHQLTNPYFYQLLEFLFWH
jgi:hypothetical protein